MLKSKWMCRNIARSVSQYVGFIGLGNMGSRMVKNLAKKGENMLVYDDAKATMKHVEELPNVSVASSLPEIAKNSSLIITMLPATKHVVHVYTNNGLLEYCKEGSVFIDCSTISPNASKVVNAMAKQKNCNFIDAPVSGGITGAEEGTLTFMVGGELATVASVKALLMKMGTNVVHCGSVGAGEAIKLCNNMLLGCTMVAVAEAFNLGIKFGLDKNLLASVINSSSGKCWSSEVYNPVPGILPNVPSSNNYQGGFKMELMLKDMELAMEMGDTARASTQLAKRAADIYSHAMASGFSEKDFSSVFKFLEELKNDEFY